MLIRIESAFISFESRPVLFDSLSVSRNQCIPGSVLPQPSHMTSSPSVERKRKYFTVSETVQVIQYKKENPNASV